MCYEEQLDELQSIITSDDSTDEQRRVARAAKKKLIDGSIGEAFARIKERTAAYRMLIDTLKGIVGRIKANQLTGAEEDLDSVIGDVQTADEGTNSPP
jgi:hypothetical protein